MLRYWKCENNECVICPEVVLGSYIERLQKCDEGYKITCLNCGNTEMWDSFPTQKDNDAYIIIDNKKIEKFIKKIC